MKQMILDACEMGAKEIYISVRPDDLISKRIIEKVGFFPFRTFSKKRFLWMCKKKEYSNVHNSF
jgi:RimJ/RimL family protein N-acetyltransferase